MKSKLIIILFAVLASLGFSQTNVSGIISGNTTWNQSGSPYIVTGNILVNSGVTLTIEPGTEVRFDQHKALLVNGELIAIGSEDSKILFTSNQENKTPGFWGNIHFTNMANSATYIYKYDSSSVSPDSGSDSSYVGYVRGSIMKYCTIEYGGGSSSDTGGVGGVGMLWIETSKQFCRYRC